MAVFDRAPLSQVERYVEVGYPELFGMSPMEFRAWLAPLVSELVADEYDSATGGVPVLLVLRLDSALVEAVMARVAVGGKAGYVDMTPSDPSTFQATDSARIPDVLAYLLWDFDPGDRYRDQPPSESMDAIVAEGRSPLTIDEAVAALVLHPELLADKHAFSILASRSTAKGVAKSVPAVWISRGAPRLGWCWNNNPHSWLGSASCAERGV